jgi:Flp pilus assembly protein TadD
MASVDSYFPPYLSVMRLRLLFVFFGFVISAGSSLLSARDIRITIPARSNLTPVQRLNRDGVGAILSHKYEKAEGLFYKAYLYDPADPFTLTNLGYVSELKGDLNEAEKFYKLAEEQSCDAVIDRTNIRQLKGKPMSDALGTLKNVTMRINRMNILGIEMLSQDRGFEAENILMQALALDSKNPFTLNNLGVAKESVGDFEAALRYYDAAAAARSTEPIVVTLTRSSRGKPVSRVAAESAMNLRNRMHKMDISRIRANMLVMRGVSEVNQNNWNSAKKDFLEAYSLDPNSAFTLNNLGYVAEKEDDPETAQFFYARARKAGNADARIGLATQSVAKGEHLGAVAGENDEKIGSELDAYTQRRKEEQGPIELVPRYGSEPPSQPVKPVEKTPSNSPSPQAPNH